MNICIRCGKEIHKGNYCVGHYLRTSKIREKCKESQTGKRHTPESILKMSEVKIGHFMSEETKTKISQSNKGKPKSEEHKQKISKTLCGKYVGLDNPRYGVILTDETKKKMSEAKKGKKLSEEHKRKISESEMGEKNPFYNKQHSEETLKKISGENSVHWKGGISEQLYSKRFNRKLKNQIRIRDNNICQLCGKTKEENYNRKLSVHHINYNKEDLSVTNLITLCVSCNTKVNLNRNHWEEFFTNVLRKRGLKKS